MAVVGVLLAHHWVLRVNVFDPDHLEETQMHLSGDPETKMKMCDFKTLTSEPGGSLRSNLFSFMPFG